MLIATKISQKNKLFIYAAIIIAMFSGGGFSVYRYYINNLELIAPPIVIPAVIDRLGDKKIMPEPALEVVDSESQEVSTKINEVFDMEIFSSPKFRSLRENVAPIINVDPGTRNPFERGE